MAGREDAKRADKAYHKGKLNQAAGTSATTDWGRVMTQGGVKEELQKRTRDIGGAPRGGGLRVHWRRTVRRQQWQQLASARAKVNFALHSACSRSGECNAGGIRGG